MMIMLVVLISLMTLNLILVTIYIYRASKYLELILKYSLRQIELTREYNELAREVWQRSTSKI